MQSVIMDKWTAWVLIALAAAILLQIDWAMYLFAVMLVGLAYLAQTSEAIVSEKLEKIETKSEPAPAPKQPQQIIVTQPTGGSYIDQVYANLITESLLRGKRGLRAWSKKSIAQRYSTLESGLGDINYVESDILGAVKKMNDSIDKLSKQLDKRDDRR